MFFPHFGEPTIFDNFLKCWFPLGTILEHDSNHFGITFSSTDFALIFVRFGMDLNMVFHVVEYLSRLHTHRAKPFF